jgi:hypothetical protein
MLLLGLAGCSSLRIAGTDGPLTTTGKVAARVPLAVVTFSGSEYWFYCARNNWCQDYDAFGATLGAVGAGSARAAQEMERQRYEYQRCELVCRHIGNTTRCQERCW